MDRIVLIYSIYLFLYKCDANWQIDLIAFYYTIQVLRKVLHSIFFIYYTLTYG